MWTTGASTPSPTLPPTAGLTAEATVEVIAKDLAGLRAILEDMLAAPHGTTWRACARRWPAQDGCKYL